MCFAVYCSVLFLFYRSNVLQCVAVYLNVLQCVVSPSPRFSALQCLALCCIALQYTAVHYSVFRCVTVYHSALQRVKPPSLYCSVL